MEKKVKKKVVNKRVVAPIISPKQHLEGQKIVEAALQNEKWINERIALKERLKFLNRVLK